MLLALFIFFIRLRESVCVNPDASPVTDPKVVLLSPDDFDVYVRIGENYNVTWVFAIEGNPLKQRENLEAVKVVVKDKAAATMLQYKQVDEKPLLPIYNMPETVAPESLDAEDAENFWFIEIPSNSNFMYVHYSISNVVTGNGKVLELMVKIDDSITYSNANVIVHQAALVSELDQLLISEPLTSYFDQIIEGIPTPEYVASCVTESDEIFFDDVSMDTLTSQTQGKLSFNKNKDVLAYMGCLKIRVTVSNNVCRGVDYNLPDRNPNPTESKLLNLDHIMECEEATSSDFVWLDAPKSCEPVKETCAVALGGKEAVWKANRNMDQMDDILSKCTKAFCSEMMSNFTCSYFFESCDPGMKQPYLCSENYDLTKHMFPEAFEVLAPSEELVRAKCSQPDKKASFSAINKMDCLPLEVNLPQSSYGWMYVGPVDSSATGRNCVDWDAVEVKDKSDMYFLDLSAGYKPNFCRHLYNHNFSYPGCFVIDDFGTQVFETCDIEQCPERVIPIEDLSSTMSSGELVTNPINSSDRLLLMIAGPTVIVFALGAFAVCIYIRRKQNEVELVPVSSNALGNIPLRQNPKFAGPIEHNTGTMQSQQSSQYQGGGTLPLTPPNSTLNRIMMNYDSESNSSLTRYPSPRMKNIDPRLEYDRNKIRYVADLGNGAFGRVFHAHVPDLADPNRMIDVAVKMLKEDHNQEMKKEFEQEALLLANFSHPNIVKLRGVCSVGSPFCVLLDFMKEGDLNKFLASCQPLSSVRQPGSTQRYLSTADLLMISQQIASGMSYVSEKHFIHRDLATRNCLVTDNLTVKISDFGLSKNLGDQEFLILPNAEGVIPVRWMAPEALDQGRYSKHSDVWSYGVLLWEVFSFAMQPYYGKEHEEIINYVVYEKGVLPPINSNIEIPADVYEVMKRCWTYEPTRRPTFRQLYELIDNLLKKYTSSPLSLHSRAYKAHNPSMHCKSASQAAYSRPMPGAGPVLKARTYSQFDSPC